MDADDSAVRVPAEPRRLVAAVLATGLVRVRDPDADEDLEEPAGGDALSPREQEVLRLLARGWSNRMIARHLELSEHTVKTHVSVVLGKLGAESRTAAVTLAIRRGLLML